MHHWLHVRVRHREQLTGGCRQSLPLDNNCQLRVKAFLEGLSAPLQPPHALLRWPVIMAR